jgi:hypothetical protein
MGAAIILSHISNARCGAPAPALVTLQYHPHRFKDRDLTISHRIQLIGVGRLRAAGHCRASVTSSKTASRTETHAPITLATRKSWLRKVKSVIDVESTAALTESHTHAKRRCQNASVQAGLMERPFITAAQTSSAESAFPRKMNGSVMSGRIPHINPANRRHRSQNWRNVVSTGNVV